MKACAVCGRLYANDAGFCQADGESLASVSQVPPPPSAQQDSRIGQLLGERYVVFRVVADGAMGRVYEGFDRQVERHVALKILHPDVARDSVSVARFKREWEVSQQVPHHHIVQVGDFFATPDGSYVLVMEFLVGEELRGALQREQVLPPERVVRILSQLALALDVAHKHKLIHRDLKPENIFLCRGAAGDTVKVLDFGSVKDRNSKAKQLTVMGTTIGSPYYMSPEQAQALETLDHRTDVWALAAVAYECVTGGVPFPGPNGPSILVQILTKAPRVPSELVLGTAHPLPQTVDRALLRGLSKSPASRTGTVGRLADELGRAYGLGGTHEVWAVVSEADLRVQIERTLPALLANPPPPSEDVDATADAFFGEVAALGEISVRPAVPSRRPVPLTADSGEEDLALPIASAARGHYALIAVGVAIALAIAYFLLR